MIERGKLICMLVGKFTERNPRIEAQDLRIQIDQHLLACNQSILGIDDNQLLQDLIDETILSVLGQGINRQQRRSVK